mgnify:CR=1 FL=1
MKMIIIVFRISKKDFPPITPLISNITKIECIANKPIDKTRNIAAAFNFPAHLIMINIPMTIEINATTRLIDEVTNSTSFTISPVIVSVILFILSRFY